MSDAALARKLRARWSADMGRSGPADDALAGVIARHAEPNRRYHTARHVAHVLRDVQRLAAAVGLDAASARTVRLAAWFHDAVYDGRPGQDEEASAVLAERVLSRLGVPVGRTTAVCRLVRMTAAHSPDPGDPDAAVLSDADLAVLAAAPARYRRYRLAVRAEYGHLTDQQFRTGREVVLRRIAGRRLIFSTATGVDRWERAARANLAAELTLLAGTDKPC